MTITASSQQKIDAYLSTLRRQLRGMNAEEVRDIVEEIRSHILDKAALATEENASGTIDAALATLGSPEELASQYITDNLLARAEASRSPVRILKSLFRWGSLSVAGFFVLLGSLFGHFFGVVFMLVAVAKLFHPHTAGLWALPTDNGDFALSFRLGFGGVPAGGRDLLGWWVVPIGWFGGGVLVMLTTHIAVWFVQQYRKSLLLPRG